MIVDETRHAIDFSENPDGLLDEEILSELRDALSCNDHFCRLVFNNNRLTDEAIGVLVAILKGRTPIEYLSLEACCIRDGDLVHIANAVCAKKVLKCIDLRRNPEITSEAIPDIARIIRTIPTLCTVLLRGTSLQSHNCAELINALERSSSMKVMELPYTVGYRVLDSARKILRKGRMESPHTYSEENERLKAVTTSRVTYKEPTSKRRDGTWELNRLPKLVPPPCDAVSTGIALTKPQQQQQRPTRALEMMAFRNWADPAVKNAAIHLYVLDQRCQLLDMHRHEKRERLRAKRGLEPIKKRTEWTTQFYQL